MTATYANYPRSTWQDASVSADPFMFRNEQESYRDTDSGYREESHSTTHRKQLPAEIQSMKKRRKRRTVASGVAGGVLGLVVLGPVGGIAGGIGSAMVAKRVGKRNEKKRMDKLESQQNPMELHGTGEMS